LGLVCCGNSFAQIPDIVPLHLEETSHAFPGQPIFAHWPYDDPTKLQGTPEQVEAVYFRVASRIRYRLQLFNNLSFDQLDRLRIEVKMKELEELDQVRRSAVVPGGTLSP
jgi:hypothetical protein